MQPEHALAGLVDLPVLVDGLSPQFFQPLLFAGLYLGQVRAVEAVCARADENGLFCRSDDDAFFFFLKGGL